MLTEAFGKLNSGDVDSEDRPLRWEERQISSVTDANLEAHTRRTSRADEMAKDLHARLARSPVEHQEPLFPRFEFDPSRSIVELRHDAVSPGQGADSLKDSIAKGISPPAMRAHRIPRE